MEAKKEQLIMICQGYPYGSGEIYLGRELDFFSKQFKKIDLLPLKTKGDPREVPANVKVGHLLSDRNKKAQKRFLFRYFRTINYILWLEFFTTKRKLFFVRNLRQWLAELTMICELAEKFEKTYLQQASPETCFYSVWMDEGALIFAILKRKKKIGNFVFRLHGYDLYEDRRKGHYMPYRYFCSKYANTIFVVSAAGKDYLTSKNIFPEKIVVNYSGLYDNGTMAFQDAAVFTVLSCSNVYNMKRVHRIAQILGHVKFELRWIHIGDGPEMPALKAEIDQLPPNITVELKGHLNYQDVIKVWKNNTIHLFIHVSETEGLPLSLVESISFGVPVVATNVGGTAEIVTKETGVLIDKEFDNLKVAERITEIKQDPALHYRLSLAARQHFELNFKAENNYAFFVKRLLGEVS